MEVHSWCVADSVLAILMNEIDYVHRLEMSVM